MIDCTAVRATRAHALERSRGGLTTKIHMLCDTNSVPLRFLLSSGQASDIAYVQPLLEEAYIPSLHGRPRKRCRWCGRQGL